MQALLSWVRQCPKPHRYIIGTYCSSLALDLFKQLMRANQEQGYRRLAALREASNQLDQLKVFLRLAKDSQALTLKHYGHLQGLLQDVGKQLGGWMKSLETKGPAHGEPSREM